MTQRAKKIFFYQRSSSVEVIETLMSLGVRLIKWKFKIYRILMISYKNSDWYALLWIVNSKNKVIYTTNFEFLLKAFIVSLRTAISSPSQWVYSNSLNFHFFILLNYIINFDSLGGLENSFSCNWTQTNFLSLKAVLKVDRNREAVHFE